MQYTGNLMSTKDQVEPISGTAEEQDVPEIESPFKKMSLGDESKRTRKLTNKGKQYQEELLKDLFRKTKKKVEDQINAIDDLIKNDNVNALNQESDQLDKLFNELLDITGHRRDMIESSKEKDELSNVIDNLDGQVFTLKRKIAELTFQQGYTVEESTKTSLASRSQISSHASRSSKRSSIVDQKAVIAGLEAEAEAKKRTQEAELQADMANIEIENAHTRKVKEAMQRAELLRLEEQIEKAKAIE